MRRVSNRKSDPRPRLSEEEIATAIERMSAECPLSADEITKWAERLGGTDADHQRLRNLVTFWFNQAISLSRVFEESDKTQIRAYVRRRLERGDTPDTIVLPRNFHRVHKWLPELASRLSAIHAELLDLPGPVTAALRVHFGDYSKALEYLTVLSAKLDAIAETWHRPRRGQPSLEMESEAVGLLIYAIEDFTDAKFPSPRSYKKTAEIELARLLAKKLYPWATTAQINTMLQQFHNRRLDEVPGADAPRKRKKL